MLCDLREAEIDMFSISCSSPWMFFSPFFITVPLLFRKSVPRGSTVNCMQLLTFRFFIFKDYIRLGWRRLQEKYGFLSSWLKRFIVACSLTKTQTWHMTFISFYSSYNDYHVKKSLHFHQGSSNVCLFLLLNHFCHVTSVRLSSGVFPLQDLVRGFGAAVPLCLSSFPRPSLQKLFQHFMMEWHYHQFRWQYYITLWVWLIILHKFPPLYICPKFLQPRTKNHLQYFL